MKVKNNMHVLKSLSFVAAAICISGALPLAVQAATKTMNEFTLTLKNHVFMPATLTVPAGQKIHIIMINQDNSEEEFDSDDLGREIWVKPLGQADVYFGPLKAGHYNFQGEMHASTAQGIIDVK